MSDENVTTHVAQRVYELGEDSPEWSPAEERAASFHWMGDVPRVGDHVDRDSIRFRVAMVSWEMGNSGTTIRPWARIYLERQQDG